VKLRKVESRLSCLAFEPGGVTAAEAIKRAESAVAANSGACLVSLDANLAELDERYGGPSAPLAGDHQQLYKLGLTIVDMSIGFPGGGLDHAARSLCDLADLFGELGGWDRQAVEVHINVLKLLRSAGDKMTPDQRRGMGDGLRKVVAKLVSRSDPVAVVAG
jgi:hypothetical protein